MAGIDAQKAPVSTAVKILIISSALPIAASPPLGIGHFAAPPPAIFLATPASPLPTPDGLTTTLAVSTLNHMVKYQETSLDRTFAALADPTRRALLAQLDEHENVSVSELARPFPVSLPAIMKHLDVLFDAGLVTRTKTGRVVSCRLAAVPMQEAVSWLNRYQRFWSERLDRLAAFLEEDESCQSSLPPSPSQASPSSGGSKPRPTRSTPRGSNQKK
ncbi:MAG: ArsR/SmtB family transcription factor [Methyloceanibacter sp.]